MRVLVRLVLLSGAAAAIALMVREPLARRVSARFAPHVVDLAQASRNIAPRATVVLSLPPPILPPPPPAHTPIVAVPIHKHVAAPKAAASSTVLSRAQIEDAIATRVGGARATLVRDDGGQPIGLRLSNVGLLAPYGVREGDILVSANGLALRTPDEAVAALGKLQNARHVVVGFRRGPTSYAIPIDLVD